METSNGGSSAQISIILPANGDNRTLRNRLGSIWARGCTWTTWPDCFLSPQCRNSTTRWLWYDESQSDKNIMGRPIRDKTGGSYDCKPGRNITTQTQGGGKKQNGTKQQAWVESRSENKTVNTTLKMEEGFSTNVSTADSDVVIMVVTSSHCVIPTMH